MSWKNRFVGLVFVMLLLLSCKEGTREQTYYISSENKEWLTDFAKDTVINFIDNNQIAHDLTFNYSSESFTKSSSSFLGIKTKESSRQAVFQTFYGTTFDFDLSISSTFDETDELSVSVNDYSFTYDLVFRQMTRLSTPNGYISNNSIESKVVFLDTWSVDGGTYLEVFHFQLSDFEMEWNNNTITDIYIAKGVGLIQFNTHQGVAFFVKK